jgi:hypothetical protein
MELTDDHQAGRRVESEDESESRASDPTRPEGSLPAMSRVRPASPEPPGVVAQSSSIMQLSWSSPPPEVTATAQGRKKKSRVARRAAGAAWEAKNGSPTAGHCQVPLVIGVTPGKEAVSGV